MNFISSNFLIFLLAFCLLYRLFGQKGRIFIGVAGSFYFYAYWKWEYSLLLLFSSTLDYICSWCIYKSEDKFRRRLWLALSLFGNLSVLILFKYLHFFWQLTQIYFPESVAIHLPSPGVSPSPMGISFFTFQTMSYTLDVYRADLLPCKNFKKFLMYISFFPQLVAGPIVRAKVFLPQLEKDFNWQWIPLRDGVIRFARGFVKKCCLADPLGLIWVDPVFADITSASPEQALFALVAYSFQIYFDFSGYSDMAIGLGKILGFDFPENFNYPYLARSFSEFWRRWHISLSTWLRDYLYISLGGNRHGLVRTFGALIVTMLLGGLWHGANMTFVIWGGLHGLYLCIERMVHSCCSSDRKAKFPSYGILWTFPLTLIAWAFFRSSSTQEAMSLLGLISELRVSNIPALFNDISGREKALLLFIASASHLLQALPVIKEKFQILPLEIKTIFYSTLFFFLLHLYPTEATSPFIYFQF